MAKRMFIMLAAMLAFVAGIGFIKFRQIQGAIAQASSFQPPPEAVTTIKASQQSGRPRSRPSGRWRPCRG